MKTNLPIGKIHCMFEQSGTFKNEWRRLGYEAYDYDIQNEYGETDYVIDLFGEIEKAYDNKPSVFDNINKDDIIFAFFPCIYFSTMSQIYFDMSVINIKHLPKKDKYQKVIERASNRYKFYTLLYKLYAVCDIRGFRLIIENPATTPHYLIGTQNFIKPTFIDKNRSFRGDKFKKPTAYWFLNITKTDGYSIVKRKNVLLVMECKGSSKGGVCSKERSEIHQDYARNFICDFVLGESKGIHQASLL